jgi:hypothetical protein
MGSLLKTRQFGDKEREKYLREILERASDAYKSAQNPKKRVEAMLAYAQARKDLSEFLGEDVP